MPTWNIFLPSEILQSPGNLGLVTMKPWETLYLPLGVIISSIHLEVPVSDTATRGSMKKAVLESLFNEVATLLTRDSCEYCEIFKNTYFEERLWTAASAVFFLILVI